MGNSLYDKFVAVYEAVSQDRDFSKEVLALGLEPTSSASDCGSLELFAGPAYHSEALRGLGFAGDLWCIDASSEMKRVAVENHRVAQNRYIIGALPDSLFGLPDGFRASFIFIMRWSLGLICPEEAEILMRNVCEMLEPGGKAFVELHRIDLITSNLSSLEIRERTKQIDGVTVTCEWPSGHLIWNRDEWCVDMPITVRSGSSEVAKTHSREWIYTKRDLQFWLRGLGVKMLELSAGQCSMFPASNLVVIEKLQVN